MAELNRRPRLLFLCQTLPYPADGGVWMRTYHVLRILAQRFDVTALCFERPKRGGHQHDVEASCTHLRRFGDIEAFPLPQQASRVRFAYDHLRSLLFGRVYTTYLYDSSSFKRRLRTWLKAESFDLAHMDSLDLARYLPELADLPVVVVHHNVESELLRRQGSHETQWWMRAYLRHQAGLMEKVERRWCPRVALNVVVSDRDGQILERVAPGTRYAVIPNGVDVDAFTPSSVSGEGIAYVGGTQPFPNSDALNFFCEQVLPRVRAEMPGVPVRWIGRASPSEQASYRSRYAVELTGYLPDVQPLMRNARCHVVPLRVGGGTRLKILSAWAVGKPVVSTSIGSEGLATVDGENILIRDDPSSFASAILDVLRDDTLATRIGAAARRTAEELYGWDVAARGMVDTYLRISAETRTTTHAHARAGGPSVVQA